MPALTLHQGDRKQEFVEHPVEIARRALNEAAKLDYDAGNLRWASLLSSAASALPNREPIMKGGG